jgi:hypothetical protein
MYNILYRFLWKDIDMSNKQNRAKRAKIKAKNNRLQKVVKKKEEANERHELEIQRFGTHETETETQNFSAHVVNTNDFFPQITKPRPTRFYSFNVQYNTLYNTTADLQLEALGDDAKIYVIDDEGVHETFNRINELICEGKLEYSELQSVKNLYRNYLAVWCLSVTKEKPNETIPYCDWWQDIDQYTCMDESGNELKIKIEYSSFDELKATFNIATYISENNDLLALIDEFLGYKLDDEKEYPWQDQSLKVVEYLDAIEHSIKPVLASH